MTILGLFRWERTCRRMNFDFLGSDTRRPPWHPEGREDIAGLRVPHCPRQLKRLTKTGFTLQPMGMAETCPWISMEGTSRHIKTCLILSSTTFLNTFKI